MSTTIGDIFELADLWKTNLKRNGETDDPIFNEFFEAIGQAVMEEQGINDSERAKLATSTATELGEKSEALYKKLVLYMASPSNRLVPD